MDEILSRLLSFPPYPPPQVPLSDQQYDDGIKNQLQGVKRLHETKLLLRTSDGKSLLDVINPAVNTVPYALCLVAKIQAATTTSTNGVEMDTLWGKITEFLNVFDTRQIRYLGWELGFITRHVVEFARSVQQPQLAVPLIKNAILRLDPSGSMLTENHMKLVRLALESRNYQDAVPVLHKFILYVPGNTNLPRPKYLCDMRLSPAAFITPGNRLNSRLRYQDVLEYFLYSGMIHIGLMDWENALHSLESAVTYPTKDPSPSKIMVDAYKKWILVGLLKEGRFLPLPKTTSAGPARNYHILAKPYETVAQIFEKGTALRLKSEVEAGTTWWQNDNNLGLVLQVLAAYQRFQIRDLAKVYSRISISEVVGLTTSAETGYKLPTPQAGENLVQQMIQQGDLHATLSRPPTGHPILAFSPLGLVLTETQMQTELAASTSRIQALTKEIKQTDRMLTHDQEYIKYVCKLRKNDKLEKEAEELAAEYGPKDEDEDEDEDLMAT